MNIKILLLFSLIALLLSSCKKTTDQLFDEAHRLAKKENYDEAIKVYNILLKRNPRLQLAYYNRGFCFYNKKQYHKALFDFNQVISLVSPGGADLILTLNSEGPFALEEAHYQVPYNDALFQRARVYFFLKKNTESQQDFTKLVAVNYKDKANCYLWLSTISMNNGDTVNACAYLANAKKFANTKFLLQEAESRIGEYCSQSKD
jgi:tetratricopeptide (TPR) repeat protein